MYHTATISKTDLARRTRQVVDSARRGDTIIVESYGEEQVVVLDAVNYRILRAVEKDQQQSVIAFPQHAALPIHRPEQGLDLLCAQPDASLYIRRACEGKGARRVGGRGRRLSHRGRFKHVIIKAPHETQVILDGPPAQPLSAHVFDPGLDLGALDLPGRQPARAGPRAG